MPTKNRPIQMLLLETKGQLISKQNSRALTHLSPTKKIFFQIFFRLTFFFSGTKKFFPRNNFCSVFRSNPKIFEIFLFSKIIK